MSILTLTSVICRFKRLDHRRKYIELVNSELFHMFLRLHGVCDHTYLCCNVSLAGLKGQVFDQLRNEITEEDYGGDRVKAADPSSVTRLMADCFSSLGLVMGSWV